MQAARALTLSSTSLGRYHSTTTTRRAVTVISNTIRWRGRYQCFAAVPVPLQSEIEQPARKKRITKDERRSLVIAFVDKYRASNAGKYPNPSETQRQVGGSYYTVKSIIQELEYNNKQAATITAEKEADLTDYTHLGRTNETQTIVVSNMGNEESTSHDTQVKEETLSSIEISLSKAASNSSEVKAETLIPIEVSIAEGTPDRAETMSSIEMSVAESTSDHQTIDVPSNSDATHTHQINLENKEKSHLCPEESQNSKEAATSGDSMDLDKSKVAMEDREEATEPEKPALRKGIYKESEENQSPDRSTVWGSLRSFADGIVKLWRKM